MTRLRLAATIHLVRVSSMVDTMLAPPLASDRDPHGDLLLRRVVGDKLRAIAHPADRDEEGALRRRVPLQ